jgi:hypothetical protein
MEQEINGKVQKINDEDYEIIQVIESQSREDAVKWYQENYNCNVEDAIDAISAIHNQYKGGYKPDASEIWLLLDEYQKQEKDMLKAEDRVMQWLKTKAGFSKDAAQNMLNDAYNCNTPQNQNEGEAKKGCVITILIAITSTLSVFFLI